MMKRTLIVVDHDIHNSLKELKFNERESFNDVILRALRIAGPKLKDAKKHVEKMQII